MAAFAARRAQRPFPPQPSAKPFGGWKIDTEGADAGIRYGETLAQDVVAVPSGSRVQRMATAYISPCRHKNVFAPKLLLRRPLLEA